MSIVIVVALGLGVIALLAVVGLVIIFVLQSKQSRESASTSPAEAGKRQDVERDDAAVSPSQADPVRSELELVDAGARMAPAPRRFLTLALQRDLNVIVAVPPGLEAATALSGLIALTDGSREPVRLFDPVDVIKYITRSRGNLGVVEAGDPYAAVTALVDLYAESSPALSLAQVRETIPTAVDLLVWVYLPAGRAPVVREILELSFDRDEPSGEGKTHLTSIYRWDASAHELRATGVRPASLARIRAGGVPVPDHLFEIRSG